jgi:RNA polymerase sigma factor (sigma-70 family)
MSKKIKIVLADDHQMFLDGLYSLLSQLENVEILATANHGKQLLEKMRRLHHIDVAVVDMHMEQMDGIETTRNIKKEFPNVRVIGLTMENDINSIKEMLDAGASGYLLKNTGKSELEIALERVADGEFYLSQSVGNQLAQDMLHLRQRKEMKGQNGLDVLTEREKEILTMIAEEMTNQEIAEKLFISPKTVETHRKNLMKKIGVNNTLGVYKFAVQHKLIKI